MFEKLGALPWLDWLFNLLPTWEPWGVRIPLQYGIGLVATWGVLFTLALVIENRWPRITRQYRSVKYGDVALTITIGVGLAVVNLLPDGQGLWYRDSWVYYWFHYGLLAVGAIMSLKLKHNELKETRIKRDLWIRLSRTEPLTEWLNTYHSAEDLDEMNRQRGYSTHVANQIGLLKFGVAYSRRQHWSATAIGHMLLVPVVFYLVGLVVSAAFTQIVVNGLGTQWLFWYITGGLVLFAALFVWIVRQLGGLAGLAIALMAVIALFFVYRPDKLSLYLYAIAAFVMLAGIVVWAWMGKLDNTRKRPNLLDIHPDEVLLPFLWKPIRAFIRWASSRGVHHKALAPFGVSIVDSQDLTEEDPKDGQGPLLDTFDNPDGHADSDNVYRSFGKVRREREPVVPNLDSMEHCVPPVIEDDTPKESVTPFDYTGKFGRSTQAPVVPLGAYKAGDLELPREAPAPSTPVVEESAPQLPVEQGSGAVTPGGVKLLGAEETQAVRLSAIDAVDPKKQSSAGHVRQDAPLSAPADLGVSLFDDKPSEPVTQRSEPIRRPQRGDDSLGVSLFGTPQPVSSDSSGKPSGSQSPGDDSLGVSLF